MNIPIQVPIIKMVRLTVHVDRNDFGTKQNLAQYSARVFFYIFIFCYWVGGGGVPSTRLRVQVQVHTCI